MVTKDSKHLRFKYYRSYSLFEIIQDFNAIST